MLSDLLFIEDPKEKNKKNFYINDRNYFTKNSLNMRRTHMNFYNSAIRAKKEEQKKNPVPKILYSTTDNFYHPQQEKEKAKDFLETQKSMVQDLMDLMKNFTTELEQDEENINKNIKILNDNKIVEAKINDNNNNNKKEEFFFNE